MSLKVLESALLCKELYTFWFLNPFPITIYLTISDDKDQEFRSISFDLVNEISCPSQFHPQCMVHERYEVFRKLQEKKKEKKKKDKI